MKIKNSGKVTIISEVKVQIEKFRHFVNVLIEDWHYQMEIKVCVKYTVIVKTAYVGIWKIQKHFKPENFYSPFNFS